MPSITHLENHLPHQLEIYPNGYKTLHENRIILELPNYESCINYLKKHYPNLPLDVEYAIAIPILKNSKKK